MRVIHGPSPGGGPWTGGQCYVYTAINRGYFGTSVHQSQIVI